MNWKALMDMKCPNCRRTIVKNEERQLFACTSVICGFSIKADKFDATVNRMYKRQSIPAAPDNAEAWNNYGLREVRDDFSDSPALDL